MDSCNDTCNDQRVGRPATGKTPLRSLRSGALVWYPALAHSIADGDTLTDVVNDILRDYGRTPLIRPLTFGDWPDASPWLEAHYPGWPQLAAAIQAAAPGLADAEYIGVAVWLAMTSRRAREQRQHVIAGFLLSRAMTTEADGWREKRDDAQALLNLLKALNQVLDEQLPGGRRSSRSRPRRAGGPAAAARRTSTSP
jgi:hypothetical protein